MLCCCPPFVGFTFHSHLHTTHHRLRNSAGLDSPCLLHTDSIAQRRLPSARQIRRSPSFPLLRAPFRSPPPPPRRQLKETVDGRRFLEEIFSPLEHFCAFYFFFLLYFVSVTFSTRSSSTSFSAGPGHRWQACQIPACSLLVTADPTSNAASLISWPTITSRRLDSALRCSTAATLQQLELRLHAGVIPNHEKPVAFSSGFLSPSELFAGPTLRVEPASPC